MKPLLLLACLTPLAAHAATLKPYTTLANGTVRLSDLFDGADDRPLGPAPTPGNRIAVEAPQLTAIAHMFGVDWRPQGPGDRAILERPGRTLSRDDILPLLRQRLQDAGAPLDSDIDLPMPQTAPLPANTTPTIDLATPEYDASSGRFTTMLQLAAEGVPTQQLRLSGRVQPMVELPVPRRAMLPGEVLHAEDLQWTRMRAGLARGEVVRQAAQAEGQALRRPLQPNQPIALADLGRPIVVTKGTPLTLQLDGPGLQLTAQGVAAEPGGIGDRIHVSNPFSRAIVEAEITAPGKARVTPTQQVAAR